jgi:hypothetical protein
MRATSLFAISLLLNALLAGQTSPRPLIVIVVEGSDAINSLSGRRAKDVVVEVQDQEKNPIPLASVTAFLPASGVGGMFPGDQTIATERTDKSGRATFRGIHLRQLSGQFPIRIAAAYQGQTGTAVATQTNAEIAPPAEGRFRTRYIVMAAIAAAGAAVGIIAATHNSNGGTNPNGFAVTPGNPVIAGPR